MRSVAEMGKPGGSKMFRDHKLENEFIEEFLQQHPDRTIERKANGTFEIIPYFTAEEISKVMMTIMSEANIDIQSELDEEDFEISEN